MSNPWITHVKEFAKRNNVSYGCAISMPECKNNYIQIDKQPVVTNKEDRKDKPSSGVKYFIDLNYPIIYMSWSNR